MKKSILVASVLVMGAFLSGCNSESGTNENPKKDCLISEIETQSEKEFYDLQGRYFPDSEIFVDITGEEWGYSLTEEDAVSLKRNQNGVPVYAFLSDNGTESIYDDEIVCMMNDYVTQYSDSMTEYLENWEEIQ